MPYNGKIADVTQTDTAKHTINLATALNDNRKIIGVLIRTARVSGSGEVYFYPKNGVDSSPSASSRMYGVVLLEEGTNVLVYALSVANDDWDFICLGYVVEA